MNGIDVCRCGAVIPRVVCETCPSCSRTGLNRPEPPPATNDQRPIWELVIEDMHQRDQAGRAKYGTPLQAENGRNHLVDAYQEALDLVVYLRTEIEERRLRQARIEERRLREARQGDAAFCGKCGTSHTSAACPSRAGQ